MEFIISKIFEGVNPPQWYYVGRRDSTESDLPSVFTDTPCVGEDISGAKIYTTRQDAEKDVAEIFNGEATVIELVPDSLQELSGE